jgi:hypothetical protein
MRVFFALAGSALLIFANGCGRLQEGSSNEASPETSTRDFDDAASDSPSLPDAGADSLMLDVMSEDGTRDAASDSRLRDVTTGDAGPADGETYCPGCGVYDCGFGSWCAPDEKCTSTGSQPSGPQACCPRHPSKDAAADHGVCPY